MTINGFEPSRRVLSLLKGFLGDKGQFCFIPKKKTWNRFPLPFLGCTQGLREGVQGVHRTLARVWGGPGLGGPGRVEIVASSFGPKFFFYPCLILGK